MRRIRLGQSGMETLVMSNIGYKKNGNRATMIKLYKLKFENTKPFGCYIALFKIYVLCYVGENYLFHRSV